MQVSVPRVSPTPGRQWYFFSVSLGILTFKHECVCLSSDVLIRQFLSLFILQRQWRILSPLYPTSYIPEVPPKSYLPIPHLSFSLLSSSLPTSIFYIYLLRAHIYFFSVCVCMCMHDLCIYYAAHVRVRGHFSPLNTWVPGIELRSSVCSKRLCLLSPVLHLSLQRLSVHPRLISNLRSFHLSLARAGVTGGHRHCAWLSIHPSPKLNWL